MPKQLSKTIVNFWLDSVMLTVFLLLCWIAVVVRYVFPAATDSAGWLLWGMDYSAWADIQFAVHCLFAAIVLLHVMLHWTWICGVIENWQRKRKGTTAAGKADSGIRTLWGVGLLIVILNVLGLGIALAALSIKAPA